MNQKGFIPIALIIIGAVIVASAVFSVSKYKDEVVADISEIFNGSKVKNSNIDLTEGITQVFEEPSIDETEDEVIKEPKLFEEPTELEETVEQKITEEIIGKKL